MRVRMFSLILFFMLAGCGQKNDGTVVVIEQTKSYHTDECTRISMAHAKFMTIAEAKALNCKPCPGCEPDKHQL